MGTRFELMAMVMLIGTSMVGCAAEPERQWFTEDTAPDRASQDRLRPMKSVADQAALVHLAQSGYKSPQEALAGYDRAFAEEAVDGRKELWVLYTRKQIESERDTAEMGHFTVIVDEGNRTTRTIGGR